MHDQFPDTWVSHKGQIALGLTLHIDDMNAHITIADFISTKSYQFARNRFKRI